jgi:hypothetical protein
MTVEEAKAQFVAALNEIIASDSVAGPLVAVRSELLAQPNLDHSAIGALNVKIANSASPEVRAALGYLKSVK